MRCAAVVTVADRRLRFRFLRGVGQRGNSRRGNVNVLAEGTVH